MRHRRGTVVIVVLGIVTMWLTHFTVSAEDKDHFFEKNYSVSISVDTDESRRYFVSADEHTVREEPIARAEE